ncbi:MAG: ABC transporter ATP-binding protein [Candidatus Atribacteria bacterium]|nr:ABC transporter ATP-binding protein [Candidatus Atribacteria bacterium]
MLNINNLRTYYGVICALNNVSIKIPEKGIFTIIGANGAGKTTLLKTIMGLVKPSTGIIIFDGENITNYDTYQIVNKGISLCPEGRKIFKSLTVYENLMAGAYICNDQKLINENIEIVYSLFPRLAERRKQIAGTFSGGEQQMLAIARALMSNPKLLLLDEPSMGLAPNLVELVFETIKKIHSEQNIPLILVEQNAEISLSIADYAYVLEVGKITLEGTGDELLNSNEVKDRYLGA